MALAIMIFTSSVTVLSGLRSAPGAFAAGEGFVVSDNSAPTIFSSRVSAEMVEALEATPGITGASPEVFAFSSFNGVSFVLRGADIERLNKTGPSFNTFYMSSGESMKPKSSALVGERLLERLGVDIPTYLPLVGSYSSRVELMKLIGSFSTGTSLDDELLVSLDVARFLSGMAKDSVSIIRVSTDDPAWLAGVLSPENARFTLYDLHTSKSEASPGENVSLSFKIRNWGGSPGTIIVQFFLSSSLVDEEEVALNASSSTSIERSFAFEELGAQSLRISIAGDFPVNLYANFTVVKPYLKVSAPSKVLLDDAFNVTVTESSGEAATGSLVTFGSMISFADQEGRASFVAGASGTWTLHANLSGLVDGTASVEVLDPSAYPDEFIPSIVDFSVLPEVMKESESARCVLVVQNDGSRSGYYLVQVLVDAQPHTSLNISLAGMGSATVRFDLVGLSPGTHTVQAGSFSRGIVVESWIVENPDLVQLVIRYGGTTSLSASASIPIYQAAKISEGNVAVALFAIGAISALLSALAISSVYAKEIHESRRRLGILRTIGASRSAIWRLVFPQALESGLAGAAVGVALGVVVSDTLSRSGVFMVFGHELTIQVDTQLLVLVLVGAVLICVSTAFVSALAASKESAIRSIKKLTPEDAEPAELKFIIDD
ncbi:MAG TPA: FtsX-like permease family protein [Thermoplasmata archaeon]